MLQGYLENNLKNIGNIILPKCASKFLTVFESIILF